MNKQKKIIFSDQELATAHIFANDLSLAEKKEAEKEIKLLRMKRLSNLSDNQKLLSDLMRLKFKMEDALMQDVYFEKNNFSTFLKVYIKLLDKKQVVFAAEISLHPTKLNQIINNKTIPNLQLAFRLEKHSGGLIPALLWWKLFTKKLETDIKNDTNRRLKESKKVHFQLVFN